MSMTKVNTEKIAKQIASEKGTSYGMSIFDRKWYVGTAEQLEGIGCVPRSEPMPAPVAHVSREMADWLGLVEGPHVKITTALPFA